MANGSYQKSPSPTMLHYQHLDPLKDAKGKKDKVSLVLYDLDGTLIKPRNNGRFPKNREDWTWWHTSVPNRLKEEAEAGKHIIILSNQGVTDKRWEYATLLGMRCKLTSGSLSGKPRSPSLLQG